MNDAEVRKILPLLELLVAVAETGQVTAAADELGLPQPTLSRGLARLNRLVGADLIEKSGRGVRLTAAGQTLVPHAQSALAAAARGIDAVRAQELLASGTCAIAFQNMLGEEVVPGLIKAFLIEYPQVRFELTQGARQTCLDALDQHQADVALVSPIPEDRDDMISIDLADQPLVAVVPDDHRLAGRRRIRLTELADDPFVLFQDGFGLRSIVDDLCEQAGFRPKIAFLGQDLHTVVGLVSAGLGISVVPEYRGDLPGVKIAITGGAYRRIGACWLRREVPSALAVAFQDFLRTRGPSLTASALT